MTQEALSQQIQSLFAKAKAARGEGKRDMAKSFRAGAKRAQRKVKQLAKVAKASEKKESE